MNLRRNLLCFNLAGLFFGTTSAAQQSTKKARVGILGPQSATPGSVKLLRESLEELGWIEEKNVHFEYRYAEGDLGKISEFAADLVRLKVDVIVAGPDNGAAIAAKRATRTIPIVMAGVVDPIGWACGKPRSIGRECYRRDLGSYPRASRQKFGASKTIRAQDSRVAILRNPNDTTHTPYSKEAERAAKMLGVTIRFAEMQAHNDKNLEDALEYGANDFDLARRAASYRE